VPIGAPFAFEAAQSRTGAVPLPMWLRAKGVAPRGFAVRICGFGAAQWLLRVAKVG
jgi:hypothetical protein